jgi:hypothetical protein
LYYCQNHFLQAFSYECVKCCCHDLFYLFCQLRTCIPSRGLPFLGIGSKWLWLDLEHGKLRKHCDAICQIPV